MKEITEKKSILIWNDVWVGINLVKRLKTQFKSISSSGLIFRMFQVVYVAIKETLRQIEFYLKLVTWRQMYDNGVRHIFPDLPVFRRDRTSVSF